MGGSHKFTILFLGLIFALPQTGHALRGSERIGADKFPQVVSIPDCSAVIISDHIFATAAHCIKKLQYRIKIGKRQSNSGRFFRITDMIAHPDYGNKNGFYDIAFIKTQESLLDYFNIRKPSINFDLVAPNTDSILVGFGRQSDSVTLSNRNDNRPKQMVRLKVEGYYKDEIYIKNKQNKGACYADSGGAIYTKINDRFQLTGIISISTGYCGESNTHSAGTAFHFIKNFYNQHIPTGSDLESLSILTSL